MVVAPIAKAKAKGRGKGGKGGKGSKRTPPNGSDLPQERLG